MAQDPFFGFLEEPASLQKYQYVYNNPVNYVDPLGLSPALEYGAINKENTKEEKIEALNTIREKTECLINQGATGVGNLASIIGLLGISVDPALVMGVDLVSMIQGCEVTYQGCGKPLNVSQGVYIFIAKSGKPYVGRTNKFIRRIGEHVRGKLPRGGKLILFEVIGVIAQEKVEQAFIDWIGRGNMDMLENKRNPLGGRPACRLPILR